MGCGVAMRSVWMAGIVASAAGCSAFGDGGGGASTGSSLGNLLRYGSTTEPPIAAAGPTDAAYCPAVLVTDGRAAVKQGNAQISIANVARQCTDRAGGAVVVKVGVEGRALLGPSGGGAGRFNVPVTFLIKKGDRVVVTRTRSVAVAIPSGDTQGSFVAVEGDIVVPPGTGDFDIEVGLGGGSPVAATPRRGRG